MIIIKSYLDISSMISKKKLLFLFERYLPYLFGVDIIISNYLCDKFPSKCIKMYIHHCIYDSPLKKKRIRNCA